MKRRDIIALVTSLPIGILIYNMSNKIIGHDPYLLIGVILACFWVTYLVIRDIYIAFVEKKKIQLCCYAIGTKISITMLILMGNWGMYGDLSKTTQITKTMIVVLFYIAAIGFAFFGLRYMRLLEKEKKK